MKIIASVGLISEVSYIFVEASWWVISKQRVSSVSMQCHAPQLFEMKRYMTLCLYTLRETKLNSYNSFVRWKWSISPVWFDQYHLGGLINITSMVWSISPWRFAHCHIIVIIRPTRAIFLNLCWRILDYSGVFVNLQHVTRHRHRCNGLHISRYVTIFSDSHLPF